MENYIELVATSDTGIMGYFIGNTSFQYVTDVLTSRQKKGPTQSSEFFNVVITVWHTFCEGNEECAVWLEKLMGDELDYYVIAETNVMRELEKSTAEWATLYLFHTRSNYATPHTKAVALSNMFRGRTATTDRTTYLQLNAAGIGLRFDRLLLALVRCYLVEYHFVSLCLIASVAFLA
jgi:hypothetical protein